MDDPTPSISATPMAGSAFTRPTLSTLPIEMLDRIFWLVNDSDLINLRLVCKLLCAVANRPFAISHFSNMRHVMTEHSMKGLLAISAHEIFGAYIKKIILSPARAVLGYSRPADSEDDGVVVDDSFVKSGRFSDLMQQVLSELKQHSESVAIGVHEDYYLHYGCRDQYLVASKSQSFYGGKAFCKAAKFRTTFRTSETLELLLAETHAAAITMNNLDINLDQDFCPKAKRKTHTAIEKFLKSRGSSIDLRFQWDSNGILEYKHLRSCLHFSGSWILSGRMHTRADVLLLNNIVQKLAHKSFSKLCLQNAAADRLASLDMFFIKTLRTVILENIRLTSDFISEDLYSSLFKRLSRLQDLRYCKFDRLQYTLPYGRSSTHSMRTQSGTYMSFFGNLLLIFQDGRSEFEVQGADIPQQLKDLAAYTAAAERKKVQETEKSDGVFNHRVIGAGVPVLDEEDSLTYRAARLLQAALRTASGHDAES